MHRTFDHFKLRLPSSSVEILSVDAFSKTIGPDGSLTSMNYKQTEPYRLGITVCPNTTFVEFSGKILLDQYPDLISINNIHTCLTNINKTGICRINPERAIKEAIVDECDVTIDIASNRTPINLAATMKDLQATLKLKNNKYAVKKHSSNRFYIETTYVTHRKTECLVIYNKGEEFGQINNEKPENNVLEEEMSESNNPEENMSKDSMTYDISYEKKTDKEKSGKNPFFRAISNAEEQCKYFSDKIRFELNLRSWDRIRKFFNLDPKREPTLLSVLQSTSDPIGMFLSESICMHVASMFKTDIIASNKDLERLLLLILCEFDLNKLRQFIKLINPKSGSNTYYIKQYEKLLIRLKDHGIIKNTDSDCEVIQSHLQKVISKMFLTNPEEQKETVESLYGQYPQQVYQSKQDETTSVDLLCDQYHVQNGQLPLNENDSLQLYNITEIFLPSSIPSVS